MSISFNSLEILWVLSVVSSLLLPSVASFHFFPMLQELWPLFFGGAWSIKRFKVISLISTFYDLAFINLTSFSLRLSKSSFKLLTVSIIYDCISKFCLDSSSTYKLAFSSNGIPWRKGSSSTLFYDSTIVVFCVQPVFVFVNLCKTII